MATSNQKVELTLFFDQFLPHLLQLHTLSSLFTSHLEVVVEQQPLLGLFHCDLQSLDGHMLVLALHHFHDLYFVPLHRIILCVQTRLNYGDFIWEHHILLGYLTVSFVLTHLVTLVTLKSDLVHGLLVATVYFRCFLYIIAFGKEVLIEAKRWLSG